MRPLPWLAALVACVAIAWVLFVDAEDSSGGAESTAQELHEEQGLTEAELGDSHGSGNFESGVHKERTSVVSGHVVRVLGPNGEPLAGVRVHFLDVEGLTSESRHKLHHAVYWMPASNAGPARPSTVSDVDGIVRFSIRAGGVAHVTEESFTGDVVLPEIVQGSGIEVHDLTLRERKMVEIIVLDPSGEPLQSGTFSLDVQVASAAAADALPEDPEDWELQDVWHVDDAIGFLADGRRMLSLDPCWKAAPHLAAESGPLRHRLTFSTRIVKPDLREVEREVVGPIVFQVPATGEMRLRVEDAPTGVVPIVRLENGERKIEPSELPAKDGWFRFTGVPLNVELSVGYKVYYSEDFGGLGYHLKLPRTPIESLSESEGIAERTVQFRWPPGFRGKFIFPEDVNFDRTRFFDEVGRSAVSTKLCIRGSHVFGERSTCSLFADGSFSIPVPAAYGSRSSVDDVWGFSMICTDLKSHEGIRDLPWRAVRAWALVDAQMPSPSSVVDLGDVPLQTERPRLKVKVVDVDGAPVPQATVKPMYSCEVMSPDQLTDCSYVYMTDELGEVWFVGRNWYELIGFAEPGAKGEIFGAVTRRGVQVEHRSFASVAQEINASTREVEIRLTAAGSIAGSVELCPELSRCRIVAVPPGATTRDQDNDPLSRDVVSMERRTGVELDYFSLEGVASGNWDVVFEVSKSTNLEVLRVENVHVIAGEICRDPRLQDIKLRGLLRFAYVNFYDATGRQLTAQEVDDAGFDIQNSHSGGSMRRVASVVGNQVALVAEEEEAAFPGAEIYSHLYKRVVLTKIEAGEIDVTVHAKAEVELRLGRYSELPSGTQVTLSGWVFGEAIHPFEASQIEGDSVKIGVEETGELHLAVYLSGPNGEWQTKFDVVQEIGQSNLEQSVPLIVDIPQQTLDAIAN